MLISNVVATINNAERADCQNVALTEENIKQALMQVYFFLHLGQKIDEIYRNKIYCD